ncbi:cell wall-binding repeat-containing protein [Quadrisphaera setariae]|uniref:Cell wall-binding repeat-containing protein n=1 Tax=Quadrisphaera setariae TaxID=2593304 RepID=A0A5C8ZIV4_9ACTN|nr:cell wall-binding repeat-containing protein [Quadrisphaera setariae]TXR57995.1 cell wall-binding repeat-containing protein [Quadrisphaera setariae]
MTHAGTASATSYGADNAFTVPAVANLCGIEWEVAGARGGNGFSGGVGGSGGDFTAILPAAAGDHFTVLVGTRGTDSPALNGLASNGTSGSDGSRGRGASGQSGSGGGGGASSVWAGSPIPAGSQPLLVAGGGGGAGTTVAGGDVGANGQGAGAFTGGGGGANGAMFGQGGGGGGGGGGYNGGRAGGGDYSSTGAGGGGGSNGAVAGASVTPLSPNTGDGYVLATYLTCPSAPTAMTFSGTATTSTTVTFTPGAVNGATVTGWEYSLNGTSWSSLSTSAASGSDLQATITGLPAGTGSGVRVRAVTSNAGLYGATGLETVTTPAATPGAPTAVTAVAGNGQAGLSWTAPLVTGAGPVTDYEVTPTAVGGAALAPVLVGSAATTTTITGLTNGTGYTFTVKAKNSAGLGTASAASTAVTPAAPPAAPAPPASPVKAPEPGSHRFAGESRVQTSTSVSQQIFPIARSAPRVVLTTSATYADALAGARLAASSQAPLLMTGGASLDADVVTEINRVLAFGGTVDVLGGDQALSPAVAAALAGTSAGDRVHRIAGEDRFATALQIAGTVQATVAAKAVVPAAEHGVLAATTVTGGQPIFLVSGTDYPDGLVVSSLAARTGGIVVLSDGARLPASTRAYLNANDPAGARTIPVGGPAAAAARTLGGDAAASTARAAIVGADRYDTARKVAARFAEVSGSSRPGAVGLATGQDWPDALVGSAAMGNLSGPLLLTTTDELSPAAAQALEAMAAKGQVTTGIVFGGSRAVSADATSAFTSRIKG